MNFDNILNLGIFNHKSEVINLIEKLRAISY